MNAPKTATWIVCLVIVLALGGAARAAIIQPVGTIQDDSGNEISEWRTAATAKTLDANGDNIYGSDAKLFYGVMGDYGSYVQYIGSELQVGPYPGYAVVDHPNDVSPDIQVHTTTSGYTGGAGNLQNMFTFAIPATPPPLGFRVGVAFDGLNGAQYSPQEIRLTQTTGGSASGSINVEPFRNNTLDMAFFDVTGAAVGDRFTVQGVSGAGGFATHQIVTWDAITTPIQPGDAIKLDFSTAGDGDGVLTNWNSVGSNAPINNPIRDSDGAPLTGVSVAFTNMINGRFNNDGNAAGWGGTAGDPHYSLGADDIYFHGQDPDLSVTFSGLDPDLGYNVRIYSLIDNASTGDWFSVTDGAVGRGVQNTRNARWAAATLEDAGMVFTGLTANANGEMVISVHDVGNIYYPLNAIVLEATDPPPPRVLEDTWDFETGDLTGWNVLTSGVPGDNLVFTTAGNQPAVQPHSGSYDVSTIQGNYWIRTWEGEVLGNSDGHTGIIETDPFELGREALFTMVVGGGNHPFTGDPDQPAGNITSVNLERLVAPGDWEMIFTATGSNENAMFPVSWDASAFGGDTVRLRIYDTHTGGWGHIDVDNIIYTTAVPEPAGICLMALGLIGIFGLGWRRTRKRGS